MPTWSINEEDRQKYQDHVQQTAVSILARLDARTWKRDRERADENGDWHAFWDAMEYSGQITSEIDAYAQVGCWQDAVYTLLFTDADPESVDSGLYEGCKGWERILTVIAYSCFEEEVIGAMQALYDEDDFAPAVMAYETNERQIAYDPCRLFRIRKASWVVNLGNAIKIYAPPACVVVFEGEWAQSEKEYRVLARRVYTIRIGSGSSRRTNTVIRKALDACLDSYGVEEVEEVEEVEDEQH